MKRILLILFLMLCVPVFSAPPNAEAKKKAAQAKLLFQEYKALRASRGNSAEALAKLKAALALAPGNEEYRFAEITDSWGTWLFSATFSQKIKFMEKQIDRIAAFRGDFPKSKVRVFSNCDAYPIGLWINFDSTLSRDERKKLTETVARYRDRVLAETGGKTTPLNTAKPLADEMEMNRLVEDCARAQLPFFYANFAEWLDARAHAAETALPLLEEYAAKKGYAMTQVRRRIQKSGIFGLTNYLAWQNIDKNIQKSFFAYLKKSTSLIEKLQQSAIPDARAAAASMKTALALSKAGTGREKIKKIMFDYFAALDGTDLEWINGSGFPETGVPFAEYLSFGLPYLPDRLGDARSKFLPGLLSEYRSKREGGDTVIPSGAPKADLIALLRKEDVVTLKKSADLFRKSALLIACDSALSQGLRTLPSAVKEKIFADFNKAFKIRRVEYGDLFKTKTNMRCLGAEKCAGTVYLLLLSGKEKYSLGILAPGKPPKLAELPGFIPFTVEVIYERAFRACSDGKTLAVIGKTNILIGDCVFRRSKSFPAFSTSRPARGAYIAGNTLYVMHSLDGNVNTPKEIAFFSMDLNGANRKTIFDSRRPAKEKTTEFEKMPKPFISAATGMDNLILFRLGNALYSYDTVSGSFVKRMDFNAALDGDILEWQDGILWCSLGSNHTRLCRIDCKKWTKEDFFEQKKGQKGEVRYRIPGGAHLRPIFAMRKDVLYFGGFYPAAIRLNEPENSPFLFLPDSISVFPFEDDVLFFGRKELFFVREK